MDVTLMTPLSPHQPHSECLWLVTTMQNPVALANVSNAKECVLITQILEVYRLVL